MPREQPFSASSTSLSYLALGGLLLLPFLPPDTAFDPVGPRREASGSDSQRQPHHSASSYHGGGLAERGRAQDRERCMHLLKSVAANVKFLPPVKDDNCGTGTLVQLKSVGSKSPTIFDPPVNINCRMLASLHEWHRRTLQPASQRLLRSPVTRIIGASGYACRRVYNLAKGKMSQHAYGNAIDVSAFVLKNGRIITVRKDWGASIQPLKTDLRKRPDYIRAVSHPGSVGSPASRSDASGRIGLAQTSSKPERERSTESPQPPKPKPDRSIPMGAPTPAALFLKRLHSGACGPFRTVLGPAMDKVHRSHFHFDLNPSRTRPYCN